MTMSRMFVLFTVVFHFAVVVVAREKPSPTSSVDDSSCVKRAKCSRLSIIKKILPLGSITQLDIDVGKCELDCRTGSVSRSGDLQAYVSDKEKRCLNRHVCYAPESHVERRHTIDGPAELAVADACLCISTKLPCRRISENVTYFAGTSYETTVDFGRCVGRCSKYGSSCLASKNRTVVVETPNGPRTVEVIDKCTCSQDCFRVSHYDVYKETRLNETTGDIIATTKMIDIGRCTGHCRRGSRVRTCFIDKYGRKHCIESSRQESICFPTATKDEFVLRAKKEPLAVKTVSQCGCGISPGANRRITYP
eukprot:m.12990 g.12990  ORF g.12990 m.12990 type:complete len:308 (+) comp24444_c0_seq1:1485-2408(+)